MAENIAESKELRAFISSLEEKLLAGDKEIRWRLEDAFIASRQYGSIRRVIENNLKHIADVLSSPDSIADKEKALETIFGPALSSFRDSVELPDRPVPKAQQKLKSDSLAKTLQDHTKELKTANKELNDRAYAFAHKLRVNLEKQLREKGLREEEVQSALSAIDSDLANNLGDATTEEAMQKVAKNAWSKGLRAGNISPSPDQIVAPIEEASGEMASLAQTQSRLTLLREVPHLILKNIDKVDPSDLLSHVLTRSESGAEALEDAVGVAKIEYAASNSRAFADLAKNTPSPAELYRMAGIPEVVDLLTRNKNPSVARSIVATKILHEIEVLQEKLGSAALPGIETLRNRAQTAFVQAGAGDKKLLGGAGSVAEDLWGALGRGPSSLAQAYYRGNKPIAEALASITKNDLSGFDQLVGMMAYAQAEDASIVFDTVGNPVINWGFRAAEGAGSRALASGAATSAVPSGAAGFFTRMGAWGVVRKGLLGGLAVAGSALGLRIVGLLTGPVGWVITVGSMFATPIASWFGKFIRGQSGGTWAAPTNAVLASLPLPKKQEEFPGGDVMLSVVGCLLVPILLTLTVAMVYQGAQVQSLEGGSDQFVGPGGADIIFTQEELREQMRKDQEAGIYKPGGPNLCPVDGGRVKVGPGGGSKGTHSGNSFDSYDIDSSLHGEPVRATHDGYLDQFQDGFAENQRSSGRDYGNMVKLSGQTEDGTEFSTIYAHMMDITDEVRLAATNKSLVKAGTILGYVDQTGYSFGSHLHYEFRPRGKFTLPAGCSGT